MSPLITDPSVQFFCCLLVVVVEQVSAGAWAYHNRDKLDALIRHSVKNTVQNEYGVIDSQTSAFDTFQQHVSTRTSPPHTRPMRRH